MLKPEIDSEEDFPKISWRLLHVGYDHTVSLHYHLIVCDQIYKNIRIYSLYLLRLWIRNTSLAKRVLARAVIDCPTG